MQYEVGLMTIPFGMSFKILRLKWKSWNLINKDYEDLDNDLYLTSQVFLSLLAEPKLADCNLRTLFCLIFQPFTKDLEMVISWDLLII